MVPEYSPLSQALLGTLFTWAMTAAGAAMVVFCHGTQTKLLDTSLGFAAGVMTAASFWSLLAPAIQMAEESNLYGDKGQYAFVPAGVGFLLGAIFVWACDQLISRIGIETPSVLLAYHFKERNASNKKTDDPYYSSGDSDKKENHSKVTEYTDSSLARRRGPTQSRHPPPLVGDDKNQQWKRILLLVIAITVHNIPEGLAVGVGFGAIGTSPSATFVNARNLAVGIGIQNFPEGLAVSLPLKAAGFSLATSFWWGQLSGMVEPIFGLLGALVVWAVQPVLPYALSFAAGAMIYVVVDDIVPEANTKGNGRWATWGAIIGFAVMMLLDVGLS